jgi:hypothetical protein
VYASHSIHRWRAKKGFTSIGYICGTLHYSTTISHGLKPVAIHLPTGQAGIEPLRGSL